MNDHIFKLIRLGQIKKEMNLIYTSFFIMALAESLISIFVPVYLYKLSYTLPVILFYYFLISFSFVLFSVFGAKIVSRVGVKHAILISTPFSIAYFLLLNYIELSSIVFLALPLLHSLGMVFANYGYHLNLITHSTLAKRGRQLSVIGILGIGANVLGPLIAGLLITQFNFTLLFSVGAGLLIIGASVLFITKETYEPVRISARRIIKYLTAGQNRGKIFSFFGYGVETVVNRSVWPVYLIILLVTPVKMGLIVTGSLVVSVSVYYLIGRMTDKLDKTMLLKFATWLFFLSWLGRIFTNSAFKVLLVDTYKNLIEKILRIPWLALSYEIADKENYFIFIVVREIVFNLSRVVILPIIALVFYINYQPFVLSFILAAVFSLLYPKLQRNKVK